MNRTSFDHTIALLGVPPILKIIHKKKTSRYKIKNNTRIKHLSENLRGVQSHCKRRIHAAPTN